MLSRHLIIQQLHRHQMQSNFNRLEWLNSQLPNVKIMKIASQLKIQGIKACKHKINEYVIESLYLPIKNNNNKQIVACI